MKKYKITKSGSTYSVYEKHWLLGWELQLDELPTIDSATRYILLVASYGKNNINYSDILEK